MRKRYYLVLFAIIFNTVSAQEYDTEKLEVIAKIWGECYLFHPSVVRADREVNWEKQLLEFLPKLKLKSTAEEDIDLINSSLLSALQDRYTLVQAHQIPLEKANVDLWSSKLFDYFKITGNMLSDLGSLVYLDSVIEEKVSIKPLVIDCRINGPLKLDWHSYTPFHYFMSMLIDTIIPCSQFVQREHFGWDEYNDWWYYEQRWKIRQDDKQQKNNGSLLPFLMYQQDLQQELSAINFEDFSPISRPVYFIVNKSFTSYYESELQSLQASRNNTIVILENSGIVFSGQQGLRTYEFQDFEFILNTSLSITNTSVDSHFGLVTSEVSSEQINNLIRSEPENLNGQHAFPFKISPRKYESNGIQLSVEEKILGIIKIWLIVKYFSPYLYESSENWDNTLKSYLESCQKTHSDKEYFLLIKEIMATLNDSHVSTFHPSILDFTELFIAPVQFEWIEGKVIVSMVDRSVEVDIHTGDEIVAINNTSIDDLMKKERKRISSSNRQGLLATLINPGYFTGPSNSKIVFTINSKGQIKKLEVPRTMYVFQFMNLGDQRQASTIFENDIGYLNLAALTNTEDLVGELLTMKNTEALILDLRNSYPTADYQGFLNMLCQNELIIRQSEVPVISATSGEVWHYQVSKAIPDASFSYTKPIIVLIDKTMISRPEDLAIALKSYPNVLFVGEQTQGTDGEASNIHLPGGGQTSFTGQIIKFGSGESFQGKGIIPDIEVKRTVNGVVGNKDEILEKALEILNSN